MPGSSLQRAASFADPPAAAVNAARAAAFIAALLPLARLVWLGFTDGLSANPIEFVTRSTGTWTLVMLCLTLAVTPLRRLLGWSWLLRLRRMLGLYAFFYGCLHFTTYIWLDQWFDVPAMAADIVKRPFITAGFTAFVLMLPLALTSTKAAMRRLGRRWQRLHRLVYAVACLGVLHYWWHKAGKNDLAEPLIYAAVVAVLLGLRWWWRRARSGA
ncbi:MAG: protein-methionine-sulfoxide reductase heme-binding subunit MsrQ [Burkholderiales bacterium]|nr:protein-methionine-sulfoxide reductase heme-binding subunit MsrQ [Burkholderiales bacterium]